MIETIYRGHHVIIEKDHTIIDHAMIPEPLSILTCYALIDAIHDATLVGIKVAIGLLEKKT